MLVANSEKNKKKISLKHEDYSLKHEEKKNFGLTESFS